MTRRLGLLGLMLCAAILLSASALLARQGMIKTKDGRTLQGDIEEKPDVVMLTVRGIQTKVDRENVASLEYFDNVEARYKDRLAKLPKNANDKDHLDLARWLFDVKSYDLALREVDEARRLNPNSAEAAVLEHTIMSQRRLERTKPPEHAVTPPATRTTVPATRTVTVEKPEGKFLTADDINTIRQREWRKADEVQPRVMVPNDVRKKYVDLKGIKPAEFAPLSMLEQAYTILEDRDAPPELKKAIKLTTDPQVLAEFRRQIQPLVVSHCATTGCHGGHQGGKFYLHKDNTEREDVAYTNFFILRKYKQTFNDRESLMIDPQYENLSILAQFALPLEYAEIKHPEIKAQTYKPIAGNKNAADYRKLVAWMKGLTSGDPNYGVRYTLPTSTPPKGAMPAPATNKATGPATRPAPGVAPK